jgi:hypothetical protein
LIPSKDRKPEGLAIRESPALGVYVEGAKKIPVNSYEEIER